MSPRQLLRSFEVRAPDKEGALGQQTDRQVRQYPDAAGAYPGDATLEDHLDVTAARIRLNAGALDWRQGPTGSPGNGGAGALPVSEVPEGDRDGINLSYTTSQKFVPQTLHFWVNGLKQRVAADGSADFRVVESQGPGSGYDTVELAWAALQQDQLFVDYQPAPAGA